MKAKGHFQISGNLKAANFPQDVADFYGITVKQTTGTSSFNGIKIISFENQNFYLNQNTPNTDEVSVNFKGQHSILVNDGVHTFLDDEINFNPETFYITPNSRGGPVVNVKGKSYAILGLSTADTHNSAGDHVAWDQIRVMTGDSITADLSTTYTTAAGASVGRFTLQPDKTYEVICALNLNFSGTTGDVSFTLRDDNGNVQPGLSARAFAVTAVSNNVGSNQVSINIVSPSVATRYEIRFGTVTAFTSTGVNSFVRIMEI